MALPAADELTASHFRDRISGFPDASDAEIERALELATAIHSLRPIATIYCAAHLLALEAAEYRDGAAEVDDRGGVVVAETAGPIEAEYLSQAESERDVFFARSPYGRTFLTLERRATAFSARVFG